MITVFRTPARRIALAIALSVLIHAAILWLPYIQFPHAQVQLPPLSVRLEPLPEPAEKTTSKAEQAKPEAMHPLTRSNESAKTNTGAMAAMDRTEATADTRPFPKQLQLRYTVYNGANGFRIGEILQQLDIHGDRYNLKSVRQTSGLASLSNNDRLVQISRGRIDEHGLQPQIYEELRVTRSGKQSEQATFDWKNQKLHYSGGGENPLPETAQDTLSFLYQLSQNPVNGEFISLPVSDGAQLRQYLIEFGVREDISTPLGNLHTLLLRKMHTRGEGYFEIWLGLEYRLLPVKFSLVDGSDNVTEEYVISDIRAADE